MDAGAAHQEEAIQAARHAEAVAPTTSAGAQLSADERLVEHYLRAHLSSKTPLLDGMIAEAVDSWHTCSAADAAVAAVAKVPPAFLCHATGIHECAGPHVVTACRYPVMISSHLTVWQRERVLSDCWIVLD